MTTATNVLSAAFPRHTAKQLQRDLGCSAAQADRIIRTGRIPARLWEIAERIIEKALDANEERLKEARAELRSIRIQRMLGRVACRHADMDGQGSAGGSELDEGHAQLSLMKGDAA